MKALANITGIDDPKFPPIIVYTDPEGRTWARKVSDWLPKFMYVSEGIPEPTVLRYTMLNSGDRVLVHFSDGHSEEYDKDDQRFLNMPFKLNYRRD